MIPIHIHVTCRCEEDCGLEYRLNSKGLLQRRAGVYDDNNWKDVLPNFVFYDETVHDIYNAYFDSILKELA